MHLKYSYIGYVQPVTSVLNAVISPHRRTKFWASRSIYKDQRRSHRLDRPDNRFLPAVPISRRYWPYAGFGAGEFSSAETTQCWNTIRDSRIRPLRTGPVPMPQLGDLLLAKVLIDSWSFGMS